MCYVIYQPVAAATRRHPAGPQCCTCRAKLNTFPARICCQKFSLRCNVTDVVLLKQSTQTFAELDPHVIEARIAKMGGVEVSFQLLFGCYSVAIGLMFTFSVGV
ncbi:hypothetical protein Y032_1027g3428 [Ancylostoma ceylanicum]|uniref:Uncharacterized protein n=1 Tax=Ancylostoma ceylanicum TaxID=53326 RepID=A0A016W7I6_9BILA|nr:hypothetical protein Y032_1027g3428 [Ancylostoma ceylanicum]